MQGGGREGVLPVLRVPDNAADTVPREQIPSFVYRRNEIMKISKKAVEAIGNMSRAEAEMEEFFRAVAVEVEERDDTAVLLPPDIEAPEWYAQWRLNAPDDEDEEIEALMADLMELSGEEGEDEDDDLELSGVKVYLGLYAWSPEPGKASLSIYAHQEGGGEARRWSVTRRIRKVAGGRIHLFIEGWTPWDVEMERLSLEEAAAAKDGPGRMAERLLDYAVRIRRIVS